MESITPAYLLPLSELQSDLTSSLPKGIRFFYFTKHPVQEWIPESFLKNGYTDMEDFFSAMNELATMNGIPNKLRKFCHRLYNYYQQTPEGKRHLELILLEWQRLQEKSKFHVASEGSLFRKGAKMASQSNITSGQ